GSEAPPGLWEHVGSTAIPFPISVSFVPLVDDPEQVLGDLLDDLAGRFPVRFSSRKARPADGDGMDDEEPDDDEQDRELDLLTKTEHQGSLDRIAVRVEILRRRLAASSWFSAEAHAHYSSVIDKLALAPSLRRILRDHLGTGRILR